MSANHCAAIQASFSDYLDGAVSGHEMQEISRHIEGFEDATTGAKILGCEVCAREFAAWRLMQDALSTLHPAPAPADLGLKLRLAISREHVRYSARLRDRISLAWDNAVRPLLLQVSAGFAGATVLLGGVVFLLGAVAPPQTVLANDEPLDAITAPHYLYSVVAPGSIVTEHDTAIVVEASVDNTGRVYDYAILSGPKDEPVRMQVENQLLGSVFQPASVFGIPVRGRVIVTFSGISVHG